MLLIAAIGAFVWAVRKGQFDDLDTPALDVLHDDEPSARDLHNERRDDHAD